MKILDANEYLTRNEAAKILKVNLSTLYYWHIKEKLTSIRIGNRVYYRRSDIESSLTNLDKRIRINIKPLSINSAYQGRRFRTPAHTKYKRDLSFLLPPIQKLPTPPYCIQFKFGISSSSSDGDNLVKVTQDCIADKYGFNDKLIKRWIIDVEHVKKGDEYIEFEINKL